MQSWWLSIGVTSILVGSAIGLAWAFISSARRRNRCLDVALRPVGQLHWFLLNFVGMGSQVTLATALGLMSLQIEIAPTLLWFLLGASCISFMAALSIAGVAEPRSINEPAAKQEPQVEPPAPTPLRRRA